MTVNYEPTPEQIAETKLDEGLRLHAYPDPASPRGKALALAPGLRPANWASLSGAPWTIYYGHTGPEVHEGMTGTLAEAEMTLRTDLTLHNALLGRVCPWTSKLDAVRLRVLRSMIFNMGWDNPRTPEREGLSGFAKFLAAVERGDYVLAAVEMLKSRWAAQVGDRATRLARMMQTGRAA